MPDIDALRTAIISQFDQFGGNNDSMEEFLRKFMKRQQERDSALIDALSRIGGSSRSRTYPIVMG